MHSTKDLVFENHILDSVHGFVGLTYLEDQIEKLSIFKRLQDISQLGLIRRIFPGALHNRYIHSLGVMHMVDQMATHIGKFSVAERKLLRLSGLLHDIAHYPLSHDLEKVYMQLAKSEINPTDITNLGVTDIETFCEKAKKDVDHFIVCCNEANIDNFDLKLTPRSNLFHHEKLAAMVLKSSMLIKKLIADAVVSGYFYDHHEKNDYWERFEQPQAMKVADGIIDYVCAIIEGNADYKGLEYDDRTYFSRHFSAFIQLMHSELDADRIDYLLRDASFSGVSFGTFDLGLMLQNLGMKQYKDKWIVGVKPKGIACADQFMMNRYLAYTQIIHHKHSSITAKMLRTVVRWMVDTGFEKFYDRTAITKVISSHENNNDYYEFTDSYFFARLAKLSTKNKHRNVVIPPLIKSFATFLTRFHSPALDLEGESIFSGNSKEQLDAVLRIKDKVDTSTSNLPLFYNQKLTDHIPMKKFEKKLTIYNKGRTPKLKPEKLETFKIDRLMEGFAVIDGDNLPCLLLDHPMSSLRLFYEIQTTFYREYNIPS